MVIRKKSSGGARVTAGRKRPARTSAPTSTSLSLLPEEIALGKLVLLEEFQMRVRLDFTHVDDLIEVLRGGKKLDPVKVYLLPDGRMVVVDGFHRCKAYLIAAERGGRVPDLEKVPCEIIKGNEFEARRAAAKANQEHVALKRSNDDKRRAVKCFLLALQKAGKSWSDRKIAADLKIDHKTVGSVRASCSPGEIPNCRTGSPGEIPNWRTGSPGEIPNCRTGTDGKVYSAKPTKCTLPSVIRDLVPGKDIPCDADVAKRLSAGGVANAGDFYGRYSKRRDTCGLEPKEANDLLDTIHRRGLESATAAVERAYQTRQGLDGLLIAICRQMAARFSDYTLERVMRYFKGPAHIFAPRLLDEIAPKSGAEAASIMAAIAAFAEMENGSKGGSSLFEAIPATEDAPMKSPSIYPTPEKVLNSLRRREANEKPVAELTAAEAIEFQRIPEFILGVDLPLKKKTSGVRSQKKASA